MNLSAYEALSLARYVLALTLLASGASKVPNRKEFVLTVKRYQILPSTVATLYGTALPYVEMAVGIWLMFGVVIKAAALTAVAVLLSFLVAVGVNLMRGRDLRCGCFGSLVDESINAWTVMRIVSLIGLAVGQAVVDVAHKEEWREALTLVTIATLVVVAYILVTYARRVVAAGPAGVVTKSQLGKHDMEVH